MSPPARRARVVVAALACGVVAGIAAVTAIASAGGVDTTVPPVTTDARTAMSTDVSAFVDGEEARHAAEELIGAYIESEFGVTVADAACSVPPSGEVGSEFACYGLKPGNLVIALRATVGPQRLVELELLVDQQSTTTTSPAPATTAS
jgi:hypothetical protein